MAQVEELPPQTVPAETQAVATQEGALPLSKLVLLGTFTGPAGDQALLRSGRGKIYTAKPGDKIEGSQVTGIGDGVVVLTRNGKARKLAMPGS